MYMKRNELLFEAIGSITDCPCPKEEKRCSVLEWVAVAACICMVFTSVAVFTLQRLSGVHSKQPLSLEGQTTPATTAVNPNLNVSALYPSYSLEQLVQQSSVVAKVRFGENSRIRIRSATEAATGVFVEYTITILDSYRGSLTQGAEITLRTQESYTYDDGGIVDISGLNPEFAPDSVALVFLYQPHMGGGFHTSGEDYYYLTGWGQGAYRIDGETATCTAGAEQTPLDELLSQVRTFGKQYEVDEYWMYHSCTVNAEEKVERGEMTRQEYCEFLTQMEKYAVIIDGKEEKR